MHFLLQILILIIAAQHIAFLLLEMFFWAKPLGLKIFKQTLEQAQYSKALAANQGLYNGFLAAGLIWGLLNKNESFALELQIFFSSCVLVAGLFGAYTVSTRILFIQAAPAGLALIILCLSN